MPLRIFGGMGFAMRAALAPLLVASRWVTSDGDRGEIPDTPFSATVFAKKVLDDLLFTIEFLSTPLVSTQEREDAALEIAESLLYFGERGWLDEPAAYHVEPPALTDPDLQSEQWYGLRFHHMKFESGYEPHPGAPGRERWLGYRSNETAHAWVLEHPGNPRPWVVCVHGYRMGIPLFDFAVFRAMWLHHHLGLNVLIPVLPLHGPRAKGWRSGDGFLTGNFIDTLHLQAHAAWDLRRALSWVRTQQPTAIGVYGISLGGYNAALLAGLEPNLDCVIAGVPATDFVGMARRHIPGFVLPATEYLGLTWNRIERLLTVVSPLALAPLLPRERLFIFAGKADQLIPAPLVRDLWRHWDRPAIHWYDGGHASFTWESGVHDFLLNALSTSGLIPANDQPSADRATESRAISA